MKPFYEVILRPLVTEKSVSAREQSRYTFEVATGATKGAIREALEGFFKIRVTEVRTLRVPGKARRFGKHMGYQRPWKKAIVTLSKGQKIDLLEAE